MSTTSTTTSPSATFLDFVTMLGVCLQVFSSIELDMSLWTHVDYSLVIRATAAFALECTLRLGRLCRCYGFSQYSVSNQLWHWCGKFLALWFQQLKELKAELAALRVAKVTGGAPNKLSKMYVLFCPPRMYYPFHFLFSPYTLIHLSEGYCN